MTQKKNTCKWNILKQSWWWVRQHTECILANRDYIFMCGIRWYCAKYILRPRHNINLWHGGKYCIFKSIILLCVMISRSNVCFVCPLAIRVLLTNKKKKHQSIFTKICICIFLYYFFSVEYIFIVTNNEPYA